MDSDSTSDREFFTWCLQQSAVSRHKLARLSPDFLVVSPPKTGSTWLAFNLRCHPQLFIPDVKEVKYFSSLGKSFDLNWYLDHFAPAARSGRLKGEASPSYCLLPVRQIRLVRRLFPDVKLILLLREPIARAWSHARHNYTFYETIFADRGAFESITDEQWRSAFVHDWLLASGDYLGQLRRWLSVFPREQIHVGFYESIARAPDRLMRDLFDFLGVSAGVDLSTFRLGETILPGMDRPLPANLEAFLHELLHERTVEVVSFLREQFDLEPPAEWGRVLAPIRAAQRPVCQTPPAAFRRELDDDYLAGVMAQEEAFGLSAHRQIHLGYRGYDILFRLGWVYAVAQSLGEVRLAETDEATLARYQADGRCFIALTLEEVKERIDQQVFAQTQERLGEIDLMRAAQARIEETMQAVRRLENEPCFHPWVRSLAHVARAVRRRLRAPFRSAAPAREEGAGSLECASRFRQDENVKAGKGG